MNFYKERDIWDFFDLSIVLVADNTLYNMMQSLEHNLKYMQRNGIEVIMTVRKDTDEQQIFSLLDTFPQLNWKVLMEADTISQTIEEVKNIASNKYLLFIDPCARMETDVVYQLRYIAGHYPDAFAISAATCSDFLMVEKMYLSHINGIENWKHFWQRFPELLTMAGKQMMVVPQAILSSGPQEEISPATHNAPGGLAKLIYNWEQQKIRKGRDKTFARFSHITVPDEPAFDRRFRIIALIQVRNELHYLSPLFEHLEAYCDGVILLDDGSEDGSYEAANAANLLLKARKDYKGYFNDLENRNLLLELAYLFKCDWFFFIDADERFNGGSEEIFAYTARKDVDAVTFKLVNLWDTDTRFRVNIPEGDGGIFTRYRMFRNRGFMQIMSKNELHFAAIPFRQNVLHSPVLIKHFGLMDAAVRKKKYERYIRQDGAGQKQGYSYEYLIDGSAILRDVAEIMPGLK